MGNKKQEETTFAQISNDKKQIRWLADPPNGVMTNKFQITILKIFWFGYLLLEFI